MVFGWSTFFATSELALMLTVAICRPLPASPFAPSVPLSPFGPLRFPPVAVQAIIIYLLCLGKIGCLELEPVHVACLQVEIRVANESLRGCVGDTHAAAEAQPRLAFLTTQAHARVHANCERRVRQSRGHEHMASAVHDCVSHRAVRGRLHLADRDYVADVKACACHAHGMYRGGRRAGRSPRGLLKGRVVQRVRAVWHDHMTCIRVGGDFLVHLPTPVRARRGQVHERGIPLQSDGERFGQDDGPIRHHTCGGSEQDQSLHRIGAARHRGAEADTNPSHLISSIASSPIVASSTSAGMSFIVAVSWDCRIATCFDRSPTCRESASMTSFASAGIFINTSNDGAPQSARGTPVNGNRLVCGGHRVDTRHQPQLLQCEGLADAGPDVRQRGLLARFVEVGAHATRVVLPDLMIVRAVHVFQAEPVQFAFQTFDRRTQIQDGRLHRRGIIRGSGSGSGGFGFVGHDGLPSPDMMSGISCWRWS
nr:MAG TPA: hypothetical protein [Caudoviricetes sp.]DAH86038.1 MAG TPA: hypothetical protein [Caudoviricetes sp.]